MSQDQHTALTAIRTKAYNELFGCAPLAVYYPNDLFANADARFPIDVFVYEQAVGASRIEVAVTNGMSDQRLAVPDYPYEWDRRELIQYFAKCTEGHARRLHDMAWLSDEERALKLKRGADALIERMEAVNLPWIFDESNRPSLLE